jgi:beta-N-acetylhexosaminidase
MEVGASNDIMQASILGDICTKEGKMAGCNMAFAPVIDINYNFRNPVTNTRAFSDRPELVAQMGAEFVKSARKNNVAVTIKHFPGDGVDGRDHHLLTSVNSLSIDNWKKTFGNAYVKSIKAGARGLMVGHITLPDYFDESDPLRDVPASLNRVLLNKLLREELGYKGLTMTDATIMTGFGCMGRREELVPQAIAAGCDMFLFNRNLGEEYGFMLEGFKKGIITAERLQEALERILGLKASLQLNSKSLDELVPKEIDESLLRENQIKRDSLSKQSITLVRNDAGLLPLNPSKTEKVGVIYFGNPSMMETIFKNIPGVKGVLIKTLMSLRKEETHTNILVESLKEKGFDAFEYKFGDIFSIINDNKKTVAEWKKKFDLIIILTKLEHQSNQTSLQVNYKAMGFDAPWFVKEVPTILMNVANPYQNYDFPMVETVINSYSPKKTNYSIILDKLMGNSDFKGLSPVSLKYDEFIDQKMGGNYDIK